MGGTEKQVTVAEKSHQTITFGYINFRIQKPKVSLKHGTHLHGFDALGQPFESFLSAPGETTVKDMNTLVNRIEGESVKAIAKMPRRLVRSDRGAGRTTRSYT